MQKYGRGLYDYNMTGTRLCCSFSRIPSQKNYCGPTSAHKELAEFVRTGQNEGRVQELLSKFEGLHPYLCFIAERHNLKPFDYRVVEAYWIGNDLLDVFGRDDFKQLIPELEKRGLPGSYANRLREKIPIGAIPHHSFHVLFVGVGQLTGRLQTTLENMLNCMLSWGEVISVDQNTAVVSGPVLRYNNNKFEMSMNGGRVVSYDPALIQPKQGDMIAVHWNECAYILGREQLQNLRKYTNFVIEAVNSAPSSS